MREAGGGRLYCQLPTVNCQLSTVNCPRTCGANRQPRIPRGRPSTVNNNK